MRTWAPRLARLELIITAASVLLAGCGVTASAGVKRGSITSPAAPPTPTATPVRPPLNFRVIYDRYHFVTPEDMCKQALLVAEVKVSGVGPSRWTTPDGARPATSDYNVISKAGWLIVTPVQFSRFNLLLDHRSTPTQEFLMYGGQVGQDSYEAMGMPQLTVGSRYVIVFAPDGYPTTNPHAEDRLVVFDAFPIDAQDVVTLQQAGDPSEPGVGPVQQQVTISLAQLTQDLAHCG